MKYIEILDTSGDCRKCYFDGEIVNFDENLELINSEDTYTYKWSSLFDLLVRKPRVANVYLEQVPFDSSSEFRLIEQKIRAHLKAAAHSKVCKTICLSDVIPVHDYKEFCIQKSEIIQSFLAERPQPENYDHLLKIQKIITGIAERDINLDVSLVKSTKQMSIIRSARDRVVYDAFKSATGRLTTAKNSFPIMTLASRDREFIRPENDLFIELDFNAAEVRTLLALSGKEQPELDIHEWNMTICESFTSRRASKEGFFAWLYNPKSKNDSLAEVYNKDAYKSYYKNGRVSTPFHRHLRVSREKALNYLIQSTSSDLMLEQADKVRNTLLGKKSFIKFLMHDSIVLDIKKEDLQQMESIYDEFRKTRFGNYVVNVRFGEDYYNLKELKWRA